MLLLTASLLLFVLSAGLLWRRHLRLLREQQQRLALLDATRSRLSHQIGPGMSREQAEAALQNDHLSFFTIFTSGKSWNYIPLGRRPSGNWYCGPIQFGISIDFGPITSDYPKTRPTDLVQTLASYELADNCM